MRLSRVSGSSQLACYFLQIWNPNGTPAHRWKDHNSHKQLILLAHREGLEPPTPRFEVWCSIHLSYRCGCRGGLVPTGGFSEPQALVVIVDHRVTARRQGPMRARTNSADLNCPGATRIVGIITAAIVAVTWAAEPVGARDLNGKIAAQAAAASVSQQPRSVREAPSPAAPGVARAVWSASLSLSLLSTLSLLFPGLCHLPLRRPRLLSLSRLLLRLRLWRSILERWSRRR